MMLADGRQAQVKSGDGARLPAVALLEPLGLVLGALFLGSVARPGGGRPGALQRGPDGCTAGVTSGPDVLGPLSRISPVLEAHHPKLAVEFLVVASMVVLSVYLRSADPGVKPVGISHTATGVEG